MNSTVQTLKIIEKKKGVRTTKIKTVFHPAYDQLELRVGYDNRLYSGFLSFKEHNISRAKSTKGMKDDTWTSEQFLETMQACIQ